LLIASENAFCIIGYDFSEKPVELINTSVSDNEVIKHIGFIDDEKPQFVLLMTHHKQKQKIIVRLLKIKKENGIHSVMQDIQLQKQIHEVVMEKLQKGEASEPRHYYDNYNLYLD